MANEDVDVEALRRLAYEFEVGPVWAYIKAELEEVIAQDQDLLLSGTDRDDQIRGGIKAAKDLLRIPDRLNGQLKELLEKEETDGERG